MPRRDSMAVHRRSVVAQGRRDAVVIPNSTLTTDQSSFIEKRSKELSAKMKLYEFYNAPITKFWTHAFAYVLFLCAFTYVVLVRLPDYPHWTECYVMLYIATLMMEKIRQIIAKEPHTIIQKLLVWSDYRWNLSDTACGLLFFVAVALRLQPEPAKSAGRVIYCTTIMYWYLKILEILSSHKYLGPLVMMMGKMIKNMAYFVVLLLVVLMAFGVCKQSILNPDEPPDWRLVRNVFYQPYFMLYGEVFADDIDPDCGGPGQIPCYPGHWITPTAMSIYLLVANILLINLLIAVFNNIFMSINAMSQQVWKFQRFQVVMELEERPVFPPPLIFIAHAHRTLKYLRRWWQGKPPLHDKGLKLFLDSESLVRVHDFEEECVYGYIRERETKEMMTTEERVRATAERSEVSLQRIEDLNTKFVSALTALNSADFRMKRLEEELSLAKESYSVVHRFMVHYLNRNGSGSTSPRSGCGSRSGSRSGSPSYHSRATLREMLNETEVHMLRKRHSSTTDEDDGEESEAEGSGSSHEEENMAQFTSKFEDAVRKRTNEHLASTQGDGKVADNFDKSKSAVPLRGFKENILKTQVDETGDEGDVEDAEAGVHWKRIRKGGEEKSTVEGESSRKLSDTAFRNLNSRCASDTSSVKRVSKERKLSWSHATKNNIRKSSRASRKNSSEDHSFNPSRVSFVGFNEKCMAEESERDADNDRDDGDRRRHASHRSMSNSSEHKVASNFGTTSWNREGSGKFDHSYSSSSRPRIRVIPPSSPPPPIIKINAEYTSLADELEDVVMSRLSPPSSQLRFGRVRHHSEGPMMSYRGFHNPLRDAEEADFLIMEGLIQRRLYRDSQNLAVSLEELCSIQAEASEHEVAMVSLNQLNQSPPDIYSIPTMEKSPTFHNMGTRTDPEFTGVPSPHLSGNMCSNFERSTGTPGQSGFIRKRHSIGCIDSAKLVQSRPTHTTLMIQPHNVEASKNVGTSGIQATDTQSSPMPCLATPEPTCIDDSPNSPKQIFASPRLLPRHLSLATATATSASAGLLPPKNVISSPVHSLLIVDQSIVPLSLAMAGEKRHGEASGGLLPPFQSLASPVMHNMHMEMQAQQLRQKEQEQRRDTSAFVATTGGLPSFVYPASVCTTATLLQVRSGARSPSTSSLFTTDTHSSDGFPRPQAFSNVKESGHKMPEAFASTTTSAFECSNVFTRVSSTSGLDSRRSCIVRQPPNTSHSSSESLPTRVDAHNKMALSGDTDEFPVLCHVTQEPASLPVSEARAVSSQERGRGSAQQHSDLLQVDCVTDVKRTTSPTCVAETEC